MGKINTKFRVMVMENSLRAGYTARGLQRVCHVLFLKLSSEYKVFLYLFVYLRWFILTKKYTNQGIRHIYSLKEKNYMITSPDVEKGI